MATAAGLGCRDRLLRLTEPDFGSNPAGMRTRAVRHGEDWVLNGTKMWITNGSVADVATVWAVTEDGIRGFLVPPATAWKRPWTTQAPASSSTVRSADFS